ncbi:hypothetical protein [Chryseobacterium lactis]|uniref:FEKKY domain-containing protein n=1 Tax=Chryseobacterium lactis TaxID=1241981 RepID=UPI00069AC439|nr:hypothetical protein [Chryseobacterium lactis]
MKNCKLFLFLTILSFPGFALAQKSDEIKVHMIQKGKKTALRQENIPHFIQFGIMSKNHDDFKKKYHTGITYQNCVISSAISKQAKENNLAIAKVLTEKYGDAWKKDLGMIPYGL